MFLMLSSILSTAARGPLLKRHARSHGFPFHWVKVSPYYDPQVLKVWLPFALWIHRYHSFPTFTLLQPHWPFCCSLCPPPFNYLRNLALHIPSARNILLSNIDLPSFPHSLQVPVQLPPPKGSLLWSWSIKSNHISLWFPPQVQISSWHSILHSRLFIYCPSPPLK